MGSVFPWGFWWGGGGGGGGGVGWGGGFFFVGVLFFVWGGFEWFGGGGCCLLGGGGVGLGGFQNLLGIIVPLKFSVKEKTSLPILIRGERRRGRSDLSWFAA